MRQIEGWKCLAEERCKQACKSPKTKELFLPENIPKHAEGFVRRYILERLFGGLAHIGKTAYEIATHVSGTTLEELCLSITFILVNEQALRKASDILKSDVLPYFPIKSVNELIEKKGEFEEVDKKELENICKLVNGMKSAFIVEEDGTIRSVRRLQLSGLYYSNPLDIFNYISQYTHSIVVVGRPNIKGKVQSHVEVYKNGKLSFEEISLEKIKSVKFRDIAEVVQDYKPQLEKRCIDVTVFEEILKIATEMSPTNGASFILGDYSKLFDRSSNMSEIKKTPINISFKQLGELTTDEMIYYSSLDGATILGKTGESIAFNRELHPTSEVGEVGICSGVRHHSASNMTKDFEDSLAIVVSGDYGLITIFVDGKPVLEF
jgi:hypothetical protein